MASSPSKKAAAEPVAPVVDTNYPAVEKIDFSTRGPLMFLFVASALWLIASSLFAVISSIKMHGPGFLANAEWLTYGRVRPAAVDMFLYGFASQAAIAVAIWTLCRLGRVTLVGSGALIVGALFWNLGVLLGVGAIFAGDSTGYEMFEFPRYATAILFFSYLVMGAVALVTFAFRNHKHTYASEWFALAGLFIFPWLLSTAGLMLLGEPVRGANQAAVSYWYSNGLVLLWLTPLALAAIFYLIPRVSQQPLASHYLAAVSFWLFLFFAGWCAFPAGTRLPAWMPSVSTSAKVLLLVPVVAIFINWRATWIGSPAKQRGGVGFRFITFAVYAFVLGMAALAISGLRPVAQVLEFSLFSPAVAQLINYGFIAMTLFGAIYFIVPRISATEWAEGKIKLHFMLSLVGLALILVGWGVGGIVQGNAQTAGGDFMKSVSASVPFMGIATLGAVVLLAAHLLFLTNLISLTRRYCTSLCCSGKETRK